MNQYPGRESEVTVLLRENKHGDNIWFLDYIGVHFVNIQFNT